MKFQEQPAKPCSVLSQLQVAQALPRAVVANGSVVQGHKNGRSSEKQLPAVSTFTDCLHFQAKGIPFWEQSPVND